LAQIPGRSDDEIACYKEVINRYSDAEEPELKKIVQLARDRLG
jgi:hypothetical protein